MKDNTDMRPNEMIVAQKTHIDKNGNIITRDIPYDEFYKMGFWYDLKKFVRKLLRLS